MNYKLEADYIELHQLLKVTGIFMSGGEAKFAISQNRVKVNGSVETRKKNKIRVNDMIEVKGEKITVTN